MGEASEPRARPAVGGELRRFAGRNGEGGPAGERTSPRQRSAAQRSRSALNAYRLPRSGCNTRGNGWMEEHSKQAPRKVQARRRAGGPARRPARPPPRRPSAGALPCAALQQAARGWPACCLPQAALPLPGLPRRAPARRPAPHLTSPKPPLPSTRSGCHSSSKSRGKPQSMSCSFLEADSTSQMSCTGRAGREHTASTRTQRPAAIARQAPTPAHPAQKCAETELPALGRLAHYAGHGCLPSMGA